MRLELLERLNVARRDRRPVAVITDMGSGDSRVVVGGEDYASDPLAEEIEQRLTSGASGIDTQSGVLITVHLPRTRFVVIGAVHVAQGLVPMAKLAGFDTVVIDPRTGFAAPERFPGVDVRTEWPQDILPRMGLDQFTAVATLSHVPDIDDPALAAALSARCFYVGALGSRKSHAKRLERLRKAGCSDADLASIHAPIGLAIGAQSPAEIAVSIVAEIVAASRQRAQPAKN